MSWVSECRSSCHQQPTQAPNAARRPWFVSNISLGSKSLPSMLQYSWLFSDHTSIRRTPLMQHPTPRHTILQIPYSRRRHQNAPFEIQYPTHASASTSPIACMFAIVALTCCTLVVLKLVIPAASDVLTPRLRVASSPRANARKKSSNLMAG